MGCDLTFGLGDLQVLEKSADFGAGGEIEGAHQIPSAEEGLRMGDGVDRVEVAIEDRDPGCVLVDVLVKGLADRGGIVAEIGELIGDGDEDQGGNEGA